MEDATSALYSAFFVEEEGTQSSFRGLQEVIAAKGLFSSLYTDRGSHYWYTEEASGKVDKTRLTQVHRALQQLGITLIPAYSPEARGRSERVFRTLQDRLPKELALAGITEMAAANRYLAERFRTFRLELHPEKTRLLEFGPFAAKNRKRRGHGKPETFNFLGFTHMCVKKRSNGMFTVLRQTIRQRLRAKLSEVKTELRRRLHDPIPAVGT